MALQYYLICSIYVKFILILDSSSKYLKLKIKYSNSDLILIKPDKKMTIRAKFKLIHESKYVKNYQFYKKI